MSARSRHFIVLPLVALTFGCAATTEVHTAPEPHRSPFRIVAHAVGGAVVGSWTGYFLSQVAWSDWRQDPGRGAHRLRFTATGGTVGAVLGTLLGRRGPKVALEPSATPVERFSPNSPITADDIRASSARTLTELIRRLRPQWLHTRGRDVLRSQGDGSIASGPRVYLNGELLGGLRWLDEVSVESVVSVQFVEPGPAILRWGAGNEDGAILVSTQEMP